MELFIARKSLLLTEAAQLVDAVVARAPEFTQAQQSSAEIEKRSVGNGVMLPAMRSLLISVALTASMTAQSQMTPTSETMNVTVTEVDAVVLDAQGKPVSGLTRNDFELTVGRRRRTITNFYA